MGACGSAYADSAEERSAAKKIEEEIAKASKKDVAQVKMLLLGAGSSGKTTIFKQMRILYGTGFDETARKRFCSVVRRSVIADMQLMLSNLERLGTELSAPLTEEAKEAGRVVMEFDANATIRSFSDEMVANMACLWADAGVQEGYIHRGKLQLHDSFEYNMKNFKSMSSEAWLPTVADVLNVRVRTSGIVEETFIIDGVEFRMVDVGGQRNERAKWIHCFENVTAVIFVAAMSEYNQVLFENESVNRMVESVNLFGKTATEKWLAKVSSMILFLNKSDILEKKLLREKIPIRQPDAGLFLDYEGGEDLGAATEYIKNMYLAAAKVNGDSNGAAATFDRKIYSHVTCATNTDNVANVLAACKEMIHNKSIGDNSLGDNV